MIAIQPIRQIVQSKDLPVFLDESPQNSLIAMKPWLLQHSGACWKDVRQLEMRRLPDRMTFEFVGYFEEK